MPRGDSTGPSGMGPMTGRAAGFCSGYQMPGFLNNAPGRGMGTGFGRGANLGGCGVGFRWRNRFIAAGAKGRTQCGSFAASSQQTDPATEIEALKSQAEYLQSAMDEIKKRLDELTAPEQGK